MPNIVKLKVITGPMKGRDFAFDEHDIFVFGRAKDCHANLPKDSQVSRHHFVVEAIPPDARIRDLGSLNGTYVNDVKYGSREEGESPQQGALREYPEVALRDGDQIRVGQTTLAVEVELEAVCCRCGCQIADDKRKDCQWVSNSYICVPCRRKLAASRQPVKKPDPVRCVRCKKEVAGEMSPGRRGDYVCQACQANVANNAANQLALFLDQFGGGVKPPAIDGLEVGKQIGEGGMGAVFLARRKRDNLHVALKLMLAKVAVSEAARKKFLLEIEITKAMCHQNIVSILDFGAARSTFYFVMEFCDGGSVDGLMRQQGGKLTLAEAAPIMLQSLAGLGYIHTRGFIHRDLKPCNVLLAGEGKQRVAKIADFGLAKGFADSGFSGGTVTGERAGTIPFMPREQVTNFKACKPPTDVWSIGATFYNMLTGQFPRDFSAQRNPMLAILQQPVIPLQRRAPKIPKKVADVIDHALREKVEERFANAGEMLAALKAVL
jgi:serine/threonine-protein kinase